MKKIMIISDPISFPLDGGTKVTVYQILKNNKKNKLYYLATNDLNVGGIPLIIPKSEYRYSIINKIYAIYYIIKYSNEIDAYHFFLTPNKISTAIIYLIKLFTGKKIIITTEVKWHCW